MESRYQKWVNVSYLLIAALFGYIVFSFLDRVSGSYDLETKVRNVGLIIRAASAVLSAIVFGILYWNDQINQFMHEVFVELVRITWPTPKETGSATAVVIVMVVISGIILGFLDYCWVQMMRWIL